MTEATEEKKEENKLVQFMDSKNRVYTPHVTSRVVRVLEESMGEGVFEQLYSVLSEHQNHKGGEINERGMFKIGQRLFGSMSRLVRLLWESCREYTNGSLGKFANAMAHTKSNDGVDIVEPVEVSFTEFEQAITSAEITDALRVGLISFWEFFPEMTDMPTSRGGKGSDPIAQFAGGMFGRLARSPESPSGTTPTGS